MIFACCELYSLVEEKDEALEQCSPTNNIYIKIKKLIYFEIKGSAIVCCLPMHTIVLGTPLLVCNALSIGYQQVYMRCIMC
jgi:hypothetical protein